MSLAIGGFIGSIIAAFLTDSYQPRHCFLVAAGFGLILLMTALQVPVEEEIVTTNDDNQNNHSLGFWADLRHNIREVGEAFKMPEFRNINIYILFTGLLVPSFNGFEYYFFMDCLNVSMWTYSLLTVLSFVVMLLGTQIYSIWFYKFEYRTMILIDAVQTILIQPLYYILIFRINIQWGIPDLGLIIFASSVTDAFRTCLVVLPFTVLMAKICPKRIEATTFAVLAGIANFRTTLQGWTGSLINETFVGVT